WAAVRDWYNASFRLYEVQRAANSSFRNLLHSISYLGPLRSLPQRTYRLNPEPPAEVGVTGEHAPELLFRQASANDGVNVNTWLQALGYGHLNFEAIGDEYFQVRLDTPSGMQVNLADTGVGLSQVIPILLQGS